MKTKICGRCKQSKPYSEFNKHARAKDGYNNRCRQCQAEHRKSVMTPELQEIARIKSKEYRLNNKSQRSKTCRQYYNKNKEKIRAYGKEHYLTVKDKMAAEYREHYTANKEQLNIEQRIYRVANKERINAANRKYHATPKGYAASSLARNKRRAEKLDAAVDLTKHEAYLINCIYAFSKFKTITTGIQQHVDHIIPLSRGGKHHPSNLQILSAEENLSKGNKLPNEM